MKKNILLLITVFIFIMTTVTVNSQTLREKIGQMVWISFTGTKLDDTVKVDLRKRNIGGVTLFAANLTSPNQIKLLTDSIKSNSKTGVFVAVDQEGGKVARLSASNGFKDSYPAFTLGTTINIEDSTRSSAKMMAGWLKQCGFNVDLAPVADVNVNPNSPAIGKLGRSFSQIPEDVFKHTSWFIDEFNKKNIVTCLKHFPGHGSAFQDSHLGFTDISNTWSKSELIPYQSLLANGYTGMIMIGHLYNSFLDPIYPASLSKKVSTDLLRSQLGFNGVTITDGMAMQAITSNYSFEDAVEYAVNAGDDILLYTVALRNKTSLAKNVIDIIEQRITAGKIPVSRIEESYKRIIQLKSRMGILTSADRIAASNIPAGFILHQNYPNPFNPTTSISFTLPTSSFVSLRVFDGLGKVVTILINEVRERGTHEINFNGNDLSSGVYFYQLVAGNLVQTKKMILIK